ncbi:MAG: DUF2892 domain-containing protein [Thiohalocapsa sp.]|jgi:hypothetical protein
MVKNIGTQDRNIRYVVGALLVAYGLFTQTWWLAILGLVPIGTAAVGTCPGYLPFKISTKK